MRGAHAQASLQKPSDREPDARQPKEGGRERDDEDGRDDGQEDERESQQRDRSDGQQERGDAGGERDLGPVRSLQPLDRDAGTVGKEQEHAECEQNEARPIAEEGAEGLEGADRTDVERAGEADPIGKSRAAEPFRTGGPARGSFYLARGRTDPERSVMTERRAVESGVGDGQEHDQDRPAPTPPDRRRSAGGRSDIRALGAG